MFKQDKRELKQKLHATYENNGEWLFEIVKHLLTSIRQQLGFVTKVK